MSELSSLCTTKDTVYGKRDGVVTGLAIVNRDSRNLFRSTRGFKTGTVHQVKMHPRSQMFKPEQACSIKNWFPDTLCYNQYQGSKQASVLWCSL